ncbi:MAG: hypothetical protein KY458_01455 [Actinobacteria bacterium]|nr:hypothetical protein [Actinomycetota bacterium]
MSRSRLVPSVLAVALTLVGATAASAQRPDPGLGIRLLEAPASRSDDPRARSYIVDFVHPGTTFTRTFEVSNGTGRPIKADLYAGAARVQDGAFIPEERGRENALSSWMTVTPPTANLAAGARTKAQVKVAVPSGTRAGEYYGVVWAELPGVPPQGGGAAVSNRVGIRVYLAVGGGDEPPTSFKLESFTPSLDRDGRPGIDIRTCNDGRRAVDLSGELALGEGPGGVSAGPFKSETIPTLAPGQCGQVPIRLDPKLPRGPWVATVTLRSGQEAQRASATVTFPDRPGDTAAPVEANRVTDTTGGRVAVLVALLLLLALLVILFLFWRRRDSR